LSEVRIRPVQDDAEADAAGRVAESAYFSDGFIEEEYRPTLRDGRSRARDATLLVAVEGDGQVVGTVTYVRPGEPYAEVSRPGEAEFRMLGVDPRAQGRGVGRALVQACVDRARSEGATALVMCTDIHMQTAQGLYQRMGFRRAPDRDWVPTEIITLVGYELPLT
jgi:ribosomal protein S18 acetylase RimI-like enzyme